MSYELIRPRNSGRYYSAYHRPLQEQHIDQCDLFTSLPFGNCNLHQNKVRQYCEDRFAHARRFIKLINFPYSSGPPTWFITSSSNFQASIFGGWKQWRDLRTVFQRDNRTWCSTLKKPKPISLSIKPQAVFEFPIRGKGGCGISYTLRDTEEWVP